MPQFCVGDDAHIVPAESTDFMKNFGESAGSQWVDAGIDPYAFFWVFTYNGTNPFLLKNRQILGSFDGGRSG